MMSEKVRKLTPAELRGSRRRVDLEGGIVPPKSAIFKNKNKYNRKNKHKNEENNYPSDVNNIS